MNNEIMNLIFLSTNRGSANKAFNKLKSVKERYEFLLEGKIMARPMINTKTLKEFYRPTLNGIIVMRQGGKICKGFKTPADAIAEGQLFIEKIKADLLNLE